MIRSLWIFLSVFMLAIPAGLWIGACMVPALSQRSANALAFGIAQRDGWLLHVLVHSSGMIQVSTFAQNPIGERGAYVRAGEWYPEKPAGRRPWWPTIERRRASTACSFHLGLWLALGFFMTLHAVGWPWLRRYRRRRRNQCLACGYDLSHCESGVCPECGGEVVKRQPIDAKQALVNGPSNAE